MRKDWKKRLQAVRNRLWAADPLADLSSLDFVDYDEVGGPYADPPWQELMHNDHFTIIRNTMTKEVRGVYWLRTPLHELTDEQKLWV